MVPQAPAPCFQTSSRRQVRSASTGQPPHSHPTAVAAAAAAIAASNKGRQQFNRRAEGYRLGFAPTRSTRSERPDESVEPMRAPAGLPVWRDRFQCFASTGLRTGVTDSSYNDGYADNLSR